MSLYAKYPAQGSGSGGGGVIVYPSAASFPAAATFASYTGQPPGALNPFTLVANTAGVIGNSIVLLFISQNVDTIILQWNTANPSNTVRLAAGDGGEIPDGGSQVALTGGTDSVATDGQLAVAADSHIVYEYNATAAAWQPIASNTAYVNSLSAATSLAPLDSQAANSYGLALVANALSTQSADATHPGMVNNTAQTFSGQKTFSTGITGTLTGAASLNVLTSSRGVANGVATLDANALVPVNQIPPAALERLVIVANQAARFALTTATVQNGDTVKQTDTNVMYFVIDDTNLNNAAGYAIYNAGTAASVAWGGITGIPAPVTALSGTNTGDVTLGTASGLSLAGQALSLGVASAGVTGALSGTDWSTFNAKQPAGTYVTAVSVASANGLAGSSSGGATPALTLSTTITGILQGNGTGISAASTTGSGSVVLSTSPVLVTPALGTPSALVGTNITGTAAGLTAGTVTTNANLTGDVTSVGNITTYTTVPIAKGGTGQTAKAAAFDALQPMTAGGDLIYGGASGTGARLANGSAGQFLMSNGTTLAPSWSVGTGGAYVPTVQKFTSGSGTYTTPANVVYIRVRMVGGGGGGSGSGQSSTMGAGGNGGNTTFGTSTAGGGSGAAGSNSSAGGNGGSVTIGSIVGTALPGTQGGGNQYAATASVGLMGAYGGNSAFFSGGGGAGVYNAAGQPGVTNSGGGGGGAGLTNGATGVYGGGGGGAGGAIDGVITSPSSTYSYSVGAAGTFGTAGTTGFQGGAGGSGYIEVTEYYANGAIGTATTITGPIASSNVVTSAFTAPTIQKFTSGSGTYTLPSSPRAPLYIRVRMVGSGGGGGGGSGTGGVGGTGGNTTFGSSLLTANGGIGGSPNTGAGGAGGTASLGSGPIGTAVQGGQGSPGLNVSPSSSGGSGAPTPFGGAGGGGPAGVTNGGSAIANTGSGGGGAGSATTGGAGGGAGGFVDAIIFTPSATYAYTLSSGGTAGSAGTGGTPGTGGSGYIEVTEYYQ